mmetsp:Transcript_58763/g.143739  ORF Transcript_58763/g.143739 Transcript_58763/m.143739 type:complete len:208 (-) Transcript_58763:963-1586(-)
MIRSVPQLLNIRTTPLLYLLVHPVHQIVVVVELVVVVVVVLMMISMITMDTVLFMAICCIVSWDGVHINSITTTTTTAATVVRHKIMKLFTEGQDSLWESDCHRADVLMNDILKLLNVVLVQGVLKNSWYLDDNNIIKDDDDDLDTIWGEGAAFTASLLPMLNECSTEDANKLQTMMTTRRTESSNYHARQVDYDVILTILERNCNV